MVVALNAGHCMKTPGKQAPDGYKEYEFNMPVVRKISDILRSHGLSCIICNPSNPNKEYSLTEICNVANNAKAKIFVSVHFNALGDTWSNVRGLETFYYKKGYELAKCIHKYLIQGQPMPNRGIKTASFTVLVKTEMPAVLVECGFMDNKIDRALMATEAYRNECASEISKGILEYLRVDNEWIRILKKVSPWADTWINFVNSHPEVNLPGLIEKLYKGIA